ncbi:HDOD domain-containing protein [Sinimarinibacterium sp. CAU 1509]|uniref:HDOD domain-containing protein n=1 Tax=Sinimarinibacterium sp. CAU 1509 TaxID=2562283 RepID=UPI00146BEE07|nr:HDOD domain-containing protein [Sinimarinibacterium sp. CAU 1509]
MSRIAAEMAAGRLTLPSLPEAAATVGELVRREDVTAARLAAEIGKDPALAARLLRVANSAAVSGSGPPAESLTRAITKLGFNLTRALVSRMAIEQMFHPKSPALKAYMRRIWRQSLEVAALSRVLAERLTILEPDTAMLAGLVHLVGVLPIVRLVDDHPELVRSEAELETAIAHMHQAVGRFVLKVWKFPPELVEVPVLANDFLRHHDGPADYADVVSVSLLQLRGDAAGVLTEVDPGRVPAIAKLGLRPEAEVLEMPDLRGAYERTTLLLAA